MTTSNIACFLEILTRYGSVTTADIIKYANSPDLRELCSGCKSGTDVISAGRALEREGTVSKKIVKGGYLWSKTQ